MAIQESGAKNAITAEPHAVTVVQSAVGGSPPPGAPPGGAWIVDKYCGITTWIVGIFLLPCVCCCPCDDRTVYMVNGIKYNTFGAVVSDSPC